MDRRISRGRLRGVRLPLLLILLLGVVIRVYWVAHEIPLLQGEECEYSRLAQNLVQTHRYVGMREGPQLLYPPLFATLLGAGYLVTGHAEVATHGVPLVAGLLLILAVFALARLNYGPRVGLIAAALTACYPLLTALSGAAISESVYLPLIVGGAYFGLRCLDGSHRAAAVACGACFGLAYLTRPEALVCPFIISGVALLEGRRRGLKPAVLTALLVLVPVVVLAAPYVAYLSSHAGGFRLEGKSAMNYTIGLRRNAGMSYPEAARGLGPDLREDGPQLLANAFVATARYGAPLRDFVPYFLASAHRNADEMFQTLVRSPAFGSIFTLMLVTVALLRRPWSRRRLVRETVLLAIGLGHVFTLLAAHFVQPRYVVPLLPLLIVWAAKGIDETARWVAATVQRIGGGRSALSAWAATGARAALILVLLLISVRGLTWAGFRDEIPDKVSLKQAGIWLDRYRPGPKRIMSVAIEVPYYAKGSLLPFPYAPAARALEYVQVKKPDFLVLTGAQASVGPYIHDWYERGIPDASAREIYRAGRPGDYDVVIYEWKQASR